MFSKKGKTMNNFNIKRFGRLCLLRITERQRILGLLVLLTFVALLTVKVACAVKFFWNGDLAVRLSHIGDISRLIAYAGMGYLMTLFVDKVMRREDGIRFFMLPATNLERFLSLVVLPLVSFVVIWTVTWFAAELIWCLTLDNFFPDVYNIYLNVTDRGQNLLAFYAILVIVFSGIITPLEVISGPSNNIRSVILFIGFIVFLVVLLLMFLVIPLSLESKWLAVLMSVAYGLIVSGCLMKKAYRKFCEYEVDLEVKEK